MLIATVDELRDDIRRWRSLIPEITPTHCQGMANKSSTMFKALLRQLIESRVSAISYDLGALLQQAGHKNANAMGKLSLGKMTNLLLELTKHDRALAEACTLELRQSLRTVVEVRNDTTYEVPPEDMRAATERLLNLIERVLDEDSLVRLMPKDSATST